MRFKNIAAALVLIALGIGYGYMTAGLPRRSLPNTPDPSFFPWIITGCLLLLSVILLVQGLAARRRAQDAGASALPLRTPAVFLVVFAAYVAVLPYAGFLLTSVPFFAILMVLYGERRWIAVAAWALSVPVLMVLVFRHVFQVPLPRGALAGILG
ncbi:MAG: tripartite tricarboxylate transporter TctB family protein [Gammaproteobacteria bacterium]|nr:tripartite tricarboxylate transporter TctB family protein [Gammaproteobacteria bacterium]